MSLASSIEVLNSVQRRVHVAVAANLVNKAFDDAYKSLQKKAKLQGFRPGKAPLSMIKKLYGESVKGDVVEKLINKHLFEFLKEKQINPISSPVVEKIEDLASDKDFSFSALIDIMPEIVLKDYTGLAFTTEKQEVNENALTQEIDYLRRRHAKTKSIADGTSAGSGHLASIGHKVYHEGNLIENMDVEEFSVALGFKEIFADLESAIMGMKIGETKTSKITLPADYNDAGLAGKLVDFEIKLKNLQELALPEVDDEFAKDVGFETAEKLTSSINTQLVKHAAKTRRQKLEGLIMNELRSRNAFDVPPSMVDQVIDSMIMDLNVSDEKEKKKLLKNEDLRKSFRDTAKIKAQNTLMLWRVANQEKIEVTDESIKKHIQANMPGTETWETKKLDDLVRTMRPRLQENLMFELALDYLIANSIITDKVVT
ncbi:MAG: trigger factor [Proteobacteria bacterium]|nr:trigger factor [Pseudomonadota bacterium]